jgi:hypothetical protein
MSAYESERCLSDGEAEEGETAHVKSSTARHAAATLNRRRRAGLVISILFFFVVVIVVIIFIGNRSELQRLNADDFEIGRALGAGDDFSFVQIDDIDIDFTFTFRTN